MGKLVFLGTSAAVPDLAHDNTHMLLKTREHLLLIDTGSNAFVRLQQSGYDPLQVTDLLVTHFHPDHAAGLPGFLMSSWLSGRVSRLNLYGLPDTLARIQENLNLYDWQDFPNFYPLDFHAVEENELSPAIESADLCVYTSPVHHMIPAVGLRIELPDIGLRLAYSCDTEPCEEVVRLAHGGKILIHEASGEGFGHSSAAQAGEIARRAGVESLYLVHYPTGEFDPTPLPVEAGRAFTGQIVLARDFMMIDF